MNDAIEKYPDRERQCPMCGNDDVDFGDYFAMTIGIGTSMTVLCNACRYTETGSDADALYQKWTRPN